MKVLLSLAFILGLCIYGYKKLAHKDSTFKKKGGYGGASGGNKSKDKHLK